MVTLINCFEVPAGRENEFFALWQEVNAYMRVKAGYLGHKLHRSLSQDAPYRFVNIALWASLQDFQGAHDEGFRALVNRPCWEPFRSTPGLYEVVHEAQSGSAAATI